MTSWYSQQKEKWLEKVTELEATNKTLLENNLSLQKENKILIQLDQKKTQYIAGLKDTIWNLKNTFTCNTYRIVDTPDGFKMEFEFERK